MAGIERGLMELNGDSRAVEEIHSLSGETIPPVQSRSSGIGMGDVMFI